MSIASIISWLYPAARSEYVITDASDLTRIKDLWTQRMTGVLDAGRALRLAVLSAESVEAVEAITDDRE